MKSTIFVEVGLDQDRLPEKISWTATDSTADMMQKAKATMLSFWDGEESSALRLDLWTKEMRVDEMADFYYQTCMGMADTFDRATHLEPLVADMKAYAKEFYAKFRATQITPNK